MATFPASNKVDDSFVEGKGGQWNRHPGRHFQAQLLDQRSFVRTLRLEHKRAERSNNRFGLLVVEGGAPLQGGSGAKSLANIVAAISNSTRETDTLGWYEQGTKLGVVFTEIASSDITAVSRIVDRITRALRLVLSAREFENLKLTFGTFSAAPSDQSPPPKPELVVHPSSSELSSNSGSASLQLRHAT